MIVTFSCSNNIFVFEEGCGKYPVFPYKFHKSIDDAKEYLKTNGKNYTNIIVEKRDK